MTVTAWKGKIFCHNSDVMKITHLVFQVLFISLSYVIKCFIRTLKAGGLKGTPQSEVQKYEHNRPGTPHNGSDQRESFCPVRSCFMLH